MNEEKLGEKLNKGIEEIKNIKMTALEKKQVFENVINSPVPTSQPIKNPYLFFSFVSILQKNRLVSVGIIASLVIFLSGGVAFASQKSLPGDTLYSLKVRVFEPTYSVLIISPESKARYESSLATRRLVEAEILANEDRLDGAKEKQLNSLLENHTAALNATINQSRRNKSIDQEKGDDIVTNFHATMNAHARVLNLISEQKDVQDNNTEDEAVDTTVSKTARENADRVRETFKNDTKKTTEKYQEKKRVVQSIIDQTNIDLDNSSDHSPTRQRIIEDTHKTLEEAQQYIKEGDEKDESGDREDAYGDLLDSESSAKEAEIFLKTSLELEDNREED